jgi:hypothetical protein
MHRRTPPGCSTPISRSAASSMLVSTVTAISSGAGRPSRCAASRPAAAAACIIAVPPDACTLIIHAPLCTADSIACATVFGMS